MRTGEKSCEEEEGAGARREGVGTPGEGMSVGARRETEEGMTVGARRETRGEGPEGWAHLAPTGREREGRGRAEMYGDGDGKERGGVRERPESELSV